MSSNMTSKSGANTSVAGTGMNRSLYRDALERSGNRSVLDKSSNRTKSFATDRLSRSMTSRGQSIMNDISNTTNLNQSMDNTAKKKGKFLLNYKQMREEITPRTAFNDFVQAADDDAMTPAIFYQKSSQHKNQSLGGSYTQGKSIINVSKVLSDVSVNSESSADESPSHSRRGRRSKIDISGAQLDPDKDITKPTNRTGEGEMDDDDTLELSDQQRNQRTRRSRSVGNKNKSQLNLDPDRDVSRPTNRTGEASMQDMTLDLSDDFQHHRKRRRNKIDISLANFTNMPRDSNTFVAGSTELGNTFFQDITPSPAPARRAGRRKEQQYNAKSSQQNDFDDIEFATPALPKPRDKTVDVTGLDTTRAVHQNRQRKRARPQVPSSHDFSDISFETGPILAQQNSTITQENKNDEKENLAEIYREDLGDQNDDTLKDQGDNTFKDQNDDNEFDISVSPRAKRVRTVRGSNKRFDNNVTISNDFEDVSVDERERSAANISTNKNNTTFTREMNSSNQSNTSTRKSKIMNETRNITYSINGSIDQSRGEQQGTSSRDLIAHEQSHSKASGSSDTDSAINQQNARADRSANLSSRSMFNQTKNISGSKLAGTGSQKTRTSFVGSSQETRSSFVGSSQETRSSFVGSSQETRSSFVGSSQETRSPGATGRRRRGDRPNVAANTDDFDLSDFDNVEPMPVINNASMPSFLQVTDAEENDETLTNIDNFINKTAVNEETNIEASKTMTPQNKTDKINKTGSNKSKEIVERSGLADEMSREGVADDDVMGDVGVSPASNNPITNSSRLQTREFADIVNTPSPSSRILAQQVKDQARNEEFSILEEKRVRNAARKSIAAGNLIKIPELSNIAENSELQSGYQRSSRSKIISVNRSDQQDITLATDPDLDMDKSSRSDMGRTSRKSVYQSGYPAEPGQLETTGSFSPNIESTRIGAMMNLTNMESPIEAAPRRESLRLITPGIQEQAASRVNTSTPEAARKDTPDGSRRVNKTPGSGQAKSSESMKQKSQNTTTNTSQTSTDTSEARDIVNSLTEKASGHAAASSSRGLSVTLASGSGRIPVRQAKSVDLRRKSFHSGIFNPEQTMDTPEFIRRAKRLSSMGVPAAHSLYQSKLTTSMIAEGGTQTTPTISILQDTDDLIESVLFRNKNTLMSTTSAQVTPGLKNHTIKSLTSATFNLNEITRFSVNQDLDNEPDIDLTGADFDQHQIGKGPRLSTLLEASALQDNVVNTSRVGQAVDQSTSTAGARHSVSVARQSESLALESMTTKPNQTFVPDLTDTSWISSKISNVSVNKNKDATLTNDPQNKNQTIDNTIRASLGGQGLYITLNNTLDRDDSRELLARRSSVFPGEVTATARRSSILPAAEADSLGRINEDDMQEFKEKFQLMVEREAECIKNIDTADNPEIPQKELEMIQRSKQLLTQIISTGKIPQDIVQDKVTNEDESNYQVDNNDLADDSLEVDNNDQADNNDKADVNDQAEDDDQAKDVDSDDDINTDVVGDNYANANDVDDVMNADEFQQNEQGDAVDIEDENAHDINEESVLYQAEAATGLFTEDVLTQAETDDGLLTQARSQFDTEDEIADYQAATNHSPVNLLNRSQLQASVRSQNRTDLQASARSQNRSELQASVRSQNHSDLQASARSQNRSDLQASVRSQNHSDLQASARSQNRSNLQASARSQNRSELQASVGSQNHSDLQASIRSQNRSELEASASRHQRVSMVLDNNLSQNTGETRVLPSTKERKQLRQATLDRFLGSGENTLDNLSFLDTPNGTPVKANKAKTIPKPRAEKKVKPKPETIFPLKDVKFMFQRSSRYKVKKEAEQDLVKGSDQFTKTILKRCSEIARSRGDSKIRLSDMRQFAGETGEFPTVQQDPKNMEWNRRIFETKNIEYHGLVPMLFGGEYKPPLDIYEPKIIGKKKQVSKPRKSSSANNIKRTKVTRDLHSTPCLQEDDEVQLNYQTEQLTTNSKKSVPPKKGKKSSAAVNRKSRKSDDSTSKRSSESRDSSKSDDNRINEDAVTSPKRPRKSTASSSEDRLSSRKSSQSTNRSRTRERSMTQTPTYRSSQEESRASHTRTEATVTPPASGPTRGKGKLKKGATAAGKAGRNSNAVKSTKQKNSTTTNQQSKPNLNDKVNKVKVAKSMKNRKK